MKDGRGARSSVAPSVDDLRKVIMAVDPSLQPDNASLRTAVIVLATAFIGVREDALVAYTGEPRELIAVICGRLRDGQLVNGDAIVQRWWRGRRGAAEYWCHVLVAEGKLVWTGEWRDGFPAFSLSDAARAKVEVEDLDYGKEVGGASDDVRVEIRRWPSTFERHLRSSAARTLPIASASTRVKGEA